MNELEFVINYPVSKKTKAAWNRAYGLNAYYSGKHWSVRNSDAEFWHHLVLLELARQHIHPEALDTPVEVEVTFDDGLDCDNHAVIVKYIIDALKGRCYPDDNRKYVVRVTTGFNNDNLIRVRIRAVVDITQ